MQVKVLEGAASGPSVAAFLGRAVEPPVEAAVKNALRLLEDIGAIQEETEALTKLGRHLAALPLPPRVGKMLLFGVMFGCLDPILTVACCMAYRSDLTSLHGSNPLPITSVHRLNCRTSSLCWLAVDSGVCIKLRRVADICKLLYATLYCCHEYFAGFAGLPMPLGIASMMKQAKIVAS